VALGAGALRLPPAAPASAAPRPDSSTIVRAA
jgi:hypothetical protein